MKINDSVKIEGEDTRGIVTGFHSLNGRLQINIEGMGLMDVSRVSDARPTLPPAPTCNTGRLLNCQVPIPIAVHCYRSADPEREALQMYGRALDALRRKHGADVDAALKLAMEGDPA